MSALADEQKKQLHFDLDQLRAQYPVLRREIHGKKLAYLDNAASLQKPQVVIDTIKNFYEQSYSNVHRSVHLLSQEATESYEAVRPLVAKFLGTKNTKEVIFTKGTTDSLNLVAATLGQQILKEGDSIVVTRVEHHANFVPWQQLCKTKRAKFEIVELDDNFHIDLEDFKKRLQNKPKIVAFSAMSNVTGSIHPVKELSALAKQAGAVVVVDAAQWSAHLPMDVADWPDVDCVAFSGHKIGGPTGIGVLWGRESLLETLPPYQLGGDMILEVQDHETQFNELPFRFEAGTPNIAGVIGMGAAIEFLNQWNFQSLSEYEAQLCEWGVEEFNRLENVKLIGSGSPDNRGPVFSFMIPGIHPHDLGSFLDQYAVAVRAGHHCAQPLHFHHQFAASTRASFCYYNTKEELERLVEAIQEAQKFFGRSRK